MDGVEKYHGGIMPDEKLAKRWGILSPEVKDKIVLDVGCAEGWWTQRCLDEGAAQVIGIDPLRRDVGQLVAGSKGRVCFFPQRVEDAPDVWAQHLDVIFCLRVLYHTQHPTLALERFVKWLKPGGVLYVEISRTLLHDVEVYFDENTMWRFDFAPAVLRRIFNCLGASVVESGSLDGRLLWSIYKK